MQIRAVCRWRLMQPSSSALLKHMQCSAHLWRVHHQQHHRQQQQPQQQQLCQRGVTCLLRWLPRWPGSWAAQWRL